MRKDTQPTAKESMEAANKLAKGSQYLDKELAKKQAQILLDEQSKGKLK